MKKIIILVITIAAILALCACGEKEETTENTPTEEVLTPLSANQLEPGRFYVKNGLNFYQLAGEGCNFDISEDMEDIERKQEGIVNAELNRLLNFTWRDQAIPTLYKNDQLIYVSSESVPKFYWERYKDEGYSIGISGMIVGDSGKISASKGTKIEPVSSIYAALENTGMSMEEPTFTVDAINGTTLNASYLNEAGVISGMTMDIRANVDVYVGTARFAVSAAADTRYFKAFELFITSRYELSTDGYAIIEIPSYLKDGYYLLNDFGLVKYLNIERGQDENGIDLNDPYFYFVDNRTLTYYEYLESIGEDAPDQKPQADEKKRANPEDFDDRFEFTLDNPQEKIEVSVDYKYVTDELREEASRQGVFPKVYLLDPEGIIHSFTQLKDTDAIDEKVHLTAGAVHPTPGIWYVLFENYENIVKSVALDINSGNSTTFVHSGTETARKTIYFEGSKSPHDITLTWEKGDRTATEVKLISPTRVEYSAKETPGNIMANEPGRYVIKIPSVEAGEYTFEITGDNLGRVWIEKDEAVPLDVNIEETVEVEEDETVTEETMTEETGETEEHETKAAK